MIDLMLLRIAAVLIAGAAAAYADFKTGLIPDKITYGAVAVGAVISLAAFDMQAFLIAGVVFAIGYALYYAGKIGGGDVKLFAGLALIMPVYEGRVFVLSVLFVAALAAALWFGAYYAGRYALRGVVLKGNEEGIKRALILGIPLSVFLAFSLNAGLISYAYVAAIALPMAAALLFIAFEHGIRKEFFLARVKIAELEEDELIALDFMDEKQKEKLGVQFKGIIDEKLKKELLSMGMKEVPVYRNLPRFGPFILAGIVFVVFLPAAVPLPAM
ncbi:MAG: A24 family peptidase [Candidatus Diapherotrites archaeon]